MKQYTFVVKIVSQAQWVVEAETLEDAERRLQALRDEGEPPVEEGVEDSEIVSVLEDGVPIPPQGKKCYHVEVQTEGGTKRYEVFATDEDGAMIAGQDRFFEENPDQAFLSIAVEEVNAGGADEADDDDKLKGWLFRLDIVGYGSDPDDAWGHLLLYALKEPPPYVRLPGKDLPLEDGVLRTH